MYGVKFNLKLLQKSQLISGIKKILILRSWKLHTTYFAENENPKSFLIASNIGGNLNTLAFDLLLGQILKSRGHSVEVTLCGGGFEACMFMEINKFQDLNEFKLKGTSKFCNSCKNTGLAALRNTDIKELFLHSFETPLTSISLSESGISGAKRFLASSTIPNDIENSEVLRKFSHASVNYYTEFIKILTSKKYDCVIAHHGIYVPQGDVVQAAKDLGVPVFTWVQGYRKSSYIIAKDDTYHKTLISDSGWDRELTEYENLQIKSYLESRDSGENDWIRFGISTRGSTFKELFNKEKIGTTFLLLTNVSWDAQIHYESNIYDGMFDWLKDTIRFFLDNPESHLIIRIHPAEVSGNIKSREPVSAWIKLNFPNLSNNICIIEPTSEISTYSLMNFADVGLIYASKSGLEMLAKNKPVIVAGEAWIKNKGLCEQPNDRDEYIEILARACASPLSIKRDIEKSLRYAHYFFFRRTIQINSIRPTTFWPYARPVIKPNWVETDPNLLRIVESIEKLTTPVLD